MKKKTTNLWLLFAVNVFISLITTLLVIGTITIILYKLDLLSSIIENDNDYNPIFPLLFLIFISTIIGMVLALRIGRKILIPISNINETTKEVASGNFNISIPNNTNILAIKEMIDNLNLMIQELSSIETLRNDFLVNVSHEFKTPLAAIEGYAQLLQDPNLNEFEKTEYSKLIIDSSKQLSTLIHDILKLSKLENQEVIFDNTSFRLDEQIREAILTLEHNWTFKEMSLNIQLDKVTYYGSESLLFQVWINLIDNAIKYSNNNSTIDITLIELDDYYEVTIKDNGKGIEEEKLKHIFDKFYQTDTTRSISGNGLGLSIVKRIIDLSNNSITVTSTINKGTTFKIKLKK